MNTVISNDSPMALTSLDTRGTKGPHSTFKELIVNKHGYENLDLFPAGSETPLLHVANFTWTPGKPSVSVHEGADKKGRVMGVVHFSTFGRESTVGLGDPSVDVNAVVWEKLLKTSNVTLSRYTFDFLFGEQGRTSFLWRRTKYTPFGGKVNFELVEIDNADLVLAEYVGEGLLSPKKRGTLKIREGYGDVWEGMVVLTFLAILERARRLARMQRNLAGAP